MHDLNHGTEISSGVVLLRPGGEAYFVEGLQLALVMVVVTADFLHVIEVRDKVHRLALVTQTVPADS